MEIFNLYLKSVVIFLADVFEKFTKVSINEFDINLLYCVNLPGYTWLCGVEYNDIQLKPLQHREIFLSLENTIRGGIYSVLGERYAVSDEKNLVFWC